MSTRRGRRSILGQSGLSRRTASVSSSHIEPASSVRPPLRRSARISNLSSTLATRSRAEQGRSGLLSPRPGPVQDLASRAAESENQREELRQQSRRVRNAERDYEEGNNTASPHMNGVNLQRATVTVNEPAGSSQSTNGEDQTPKMEIVVQPPAEAGTNTILFPPITIRLNLDGPQQGRGTTVEDPGRLWAFASLTDESGAEVIAPPRTDLLSGSLVDSAHHLPDQGESNAEHPDASAQQVQNTPRSGIFLIFPGLIIKELGNYRIQVTLGRMEGTGGVRPASLQGAFIMEKVQSRPIRIVEDPTPAALGLSLVPDRAEHGHFTETSTGADVRAFLERLRGRGLAIPMAPW